MIHLFCTRVPGTRSPEHKGDPAVAQPRFQPTQAGARRAQTWLLLGEASSGRGRTLAGQAGRPCP